MTLGMPRLPQNWSNGQVLGFIRYMWQQWLLKSGRGIAGVGEDGVRGPAPPAAVAAAAKIAFSSLGASPAKLFQIEPHEEQPAEQPPMDKADVALMERSGSGTMCVPVFSTSEGDVSEWIGEKDEANEEGSSHASVPSTIRSALEDPERRNRNLKWLRLHFRSLGDIGRLPFNKADLWQLHQYYFSPPYETYSDTENLDGAEEEITDEKSQPVMDSKAPPPSPAMNASGVARTVSFQTLGDAFAASDIVARASPNNPNNNKRRPDEDICEDSKPAAKRAKNLKSRIAYYPRIMVSINELVYMEEMCPSLTAITNLNTGKDPRAWYQTNGTHPFIASTAQVH
jgi:hypothetical protein